MNLDNNVTRYAMALPNEEVVDFYGELIENIAHDERSYGPSAFTTILSSFAVAEENNPRTLYLSVLEKAKEEDKEHVMREAFDYFKGILGEFFPTTEDNYHDIREEDLPF